MNSSNKLINEVRVYPADVVAMLAEPVVHIDLFLVSRRGA